MKKAASKATKSDGAPAAVQSEVTDLTHVSLTRGSKDRVDIKVTDSGTGRMDECLGEAQRAFDILCKAYPNS